jgi:hypothetical protein
MIETNFAKPEKSNLAEDDEIVKAVIDRIYS